MVVGLLRLELHVPEAQSLKEKRSVVKSLKEQMRGTFNVSVAEVEPNDKWQRATLGVAAVGGDRPFVTACLQQIVEWVQEHRTCALIRSEQEIVSC